MAPYLARLLVSRLFSAGANSGVRTEKSVTVGVNLNACTRSIDGEGEVLVVFSSQRFSCLIASVLGGEWANKFRLDSAV